MRHVLFFLLLTVATGVRAQTARVVIMTSAVCDMCKETIERDLAFEKGVSAATLDVESKELTVVYQPKKTNPDKIRQAVTRVGYDADSLPAVPRAYQRLDDCCKKDAHQDTPPHPTAP